MPSDLVSVLHDLLDTVYDERARLVAALTHEWLRRGYKVWLGTDQTEPDWPVVYAELPTGQVSWHVSREAVVTYFGHLTHSDEWCFDLHSTREKYARLEAWKP